MDENEWGSGRHLVALSTLLCSRALRACGFCLLFCLRCWAAAASPHPHLPWVPSGRQRGSHSALGYMAQLCPESESSRCRHCGQDVLDLTRVLKLTSRIIWDVGAAGNELGRKQHKIRLQWLEETGVHFFLHNKKSSSCGSTVKDPGTLKLFGPRLHFASWPLQCWAAHL